MNLATVFGPVLLSGSLADTSHEIHLVIDLIDYYQWLFSVSNFSPLTPTNGFSPLVTSYLYNL